MQEICYACDERATSKEHCPPKCFFPKNQRKNLIKVPACPKHNNEKSDNDEWIRLIIAGIAGEKELLPAIIRSSNRKTKSGNPNFIQNKILNILSQVVPNHLRNNGKFPDDASYNSYDMLPAESNILHDHLELIARGIMYHEKGFPYKNMLFIIQSDNLPPLSIDQKGKFILNLISCANKNNLLFREVCEQGDNDVIFTYKINKLYLMDIVQLQFYKRVVVNIIFYPYPNKFSNSIIKDEFINKLIELTNNLNSKP